MKLSVIVHTRNSEGHLRRLLPTVRWAEELIVVDMESADGTRRLAEEAGARVIVAPAQPCVDAIRTRYLREASRPWTLVLDSDEHLSDDAPELIAGLIDASPSGYDAVAIPRFNRICGRVLRGSGWYPDHQIRLFRTGTVAWLHGGNHHPPEVLSGPGRLLTLEPPHCLHIHHDNYEDLREFIERQVRYAVTDDYGSAPATIGAYAAAAYEEYARRHDPEADGELSSALALIMAWDKVIRGLLWWDAAGQPFPLKDFFVLPVAVAQACPGREAVEPSRAFEDLQRQHEDLQRQLEALQRSKLVRLCRWIDRTLPRLSRVLAGSSASCGTGKGAP